MLIAKIFVNDTPIEEIHILNIGEIRPGVFSYQIKRPNHIDDLIIHERKAGWESLLMRALVEIINRKKHV